MQDLEYSSIRRLFILRHADAEPGGGSLSDRERRLTAKGIEQARRVGRFLKGSSNQPSILLTSPLRRALETAQIVSEEAGFDSPTVESFLACGMAVEGALRGLGAYRKFESVLIVGHQPDLGALASWLLGVTEGPGLEMKKGALAVLNLDRLARGGASLLFHSPPAMLPRL